MSCTFIDRFIINLLVYNKNRFIQEAAKIIDESIHYLLSGEAVEQF